MAIRDIPATGIVAMAMDIVAMDIVATMAILIMVGTIEGTTTHTIGLITEAIMDTRMVAATTAGIIEESGLASVIKTEEERGPKRGSWRRQQCVAFNSELQY
jgi:hypothetical protein